MVDKCENKTTVADLKVKLREYGAKLSGSKATLQERLKIWDENQLDKKLFTTTVIPGNSSAPFPNEDQFEGITDNLNKRDLEEFTLSVIDVWFEERSAVAGQKKGRALCMNKFVKNVVYSKFHNDYFFKCLCSAQTKTSVDYKVNLHIQLGTEPCIAQANCACPAGQGNSAACKHVSALAHLIEHFSITGESLENVAVTSKLQVWHKPPSSGRKLEKVTIDEMLGVEPTSVPEQDRTAEFCNRIINERCSTAVLENRTVDIHGYLHDHGAYLKDSLAVLNLDRINLVSNTEIKIYEVKTRKQSDCQLWKELRQTRITGSMAADVVRTARAQNWATGPALRQVHPQPVLKAKSIIWGKQNESRAIKAYEDLINEKIDKCGIFIDTFDNYLAASPDGITKERTLLVEVKCPYSVRFQSPTSATYIKNMSLMKNHKYYMQIQLQMHVTKVHKCDFIVWTTKGLFVELISYDQNFVVESLGYINQYYKKVFAPICMKYLWS